MSVIYACGAPGTLGKSAICFRQTACERHVTQLIAPETKPHNLSGGSKKGFLRDKSLKPPEAVTRPIAPPQKAFSVCSLSARVLKEKWESSGPFPQKVTYERPSTRAFKLRRFCREANRR